MLAVTIFPTLWSLLVSFRNWLPGIGTGAAWAGLDNYVWVLTNPRFWHAVRNLAYYAGVGVLIEMVLGIGLALLLYNCFSSDRVRMGLLTLLVLPLMISPIVGGDIWRLLLTPFGGAVNAILARLGLFQPNWLGKELALTSVMIADIWQWTGLPLLIVYSGRVALPKSIYEAARVDGASSLRILRRITLPMLKNLIAIAFILRFMDAYKMFDALLIMTYGGPGTASELPTFYTYIVAFQEFNLGRAAALTWVIGLGAIVILRLLWDFIRKLGPQPGHAAESFSGVSVAPTPAAGR